MNVPTYIIALTMIAGTAEAQSMIGQLCGQDHINQTATPDDVMPNPDGYYVQSLQTQLSHGDPRIVQAVGESYHLCTRGASTPDLDTSRAIILENRRVITYLFVPVASPNNQPGS